MPSLNTIQDLAKKVAEEIKKDNVPLLAAGVAFYAMLSLFPAVVAVVSIYGLVANPEEVARQLESFTAAMPESAGALIVEQAELIAGTANGTLGLSVAGGILAALWSASSGMKWLMAALTLVFDRVEQRKFLQLRGTALVLTIGAAVTVVVSVALLAGAGRLARAVGLGATGATVVTIARWPMLAVLILIGLGVLYRRGPDRPRVEWRWFSWGAGVAAALWMCASAGFALYASVAGKFSESYGAIAAVVVMMMWLFLSALAILIGGEVDAELARSKRDQPV